MCVRISDFSQEYIKTLVFPQPRRKLFWSAGLVLILFHRPPPPWGGFHSPAQSCWLENGWNLRTPASGGCHRVAVTHLLKITPEWKLRNSQRQSSGIVEWYLLCWSKAAPLEDRVRNGTAGVFFESPAPSRKLAHFFVFLVANVTNSWRMLSISCIWVKTIIYRDSVHVVFEWLKSICIFFLLPMPPSRFDEGVFSEINNQLSLYAQHFPPL